MLDERIKKGLTDRYQTLLDRGELLSKVQLEAYYATFRHRFGPEVLANLDGEALLTTMHEHGNRDSLVYWLEFKNDDEFPTLQFGSIAGGSALKFGIYKRRETGAWMTGWPQKQQELSVPEAISIARLHRDQLVAGADLLARLPGGTDDSTYTQLQANLARLAPDISDTAWGHKYFSLLYPDRLDDYHSADYQRFHLVKLLQEPPPGEGRYVCTGRFVAAASELGMPLNHLTKLLNRRNGRPYRYWRVGTSDGNQRRKWWDAMRDGNFIAVGWPDLGNLSDIEYNQASKEALRQRMAESRPGTPQSVGREVQQLFNFVAVIGAGDLVVASDGATALGIGRVIGDYRYEVGSEFPHRRPVEWLSVEEWHKPLREGLRTTVYQMRQYPDLIEIERHLLTPVLPPSVKKPQTPRYKGREPAPPIGSHAVPTLSGIPGRIQAVLDRKRQVILYGPPGTGKTYWAHLAALDLAAHAAFGMAFDQLTTEQQGVVLGDGQDQAGLVRTCAFHPAYGYEDFMEGYRPLEANGQLTFELRDGIFKRLCDDAESEPQLRFFLLVDEINRGDIPRIFGELITILERDKRGQPILLPLSGRPFSVPDNVYLIGTMNTADRSIALLDTALRRRFGFVELMPDSKVLGKTIIRGVPLGPWLDALNRRIREHVGRDARNLQVGHAYLLDGGKPVADFARFARIVQDDVIPLLEEYCYEDYDALEKILGSGLVDRVNQRIRHELFDPACQDDLVAALVAPAPDIATSLSATTVEAETPSEEAGEDDENDIGNGAAEP